MSGSITPSGSAIAATPSTHGDRRHARARRPCSRSQHSRPGPGRRAAASASGAAESQASIVARPNAASNDDTPPHRPHHHVPRRLGDRPTERVVVEPVDEDAADDEQRRRRPAPPTCSDRPTVAAVRQRFGDRAMAATKQTRASTGSSQASTPEGAGDGDRRLGERLVADRGQGHRDVRRDGGALRSHRSQHGGDHGRGVGETQGDRIGIALGQGAVGRLGGRSSRAGQQVAAGDLGGHRLDERIGSPRGRDWRGRAGWRSTVPSSAGHVLVSADLVDVGGERRAVEQLTVEVSGDQPEGGEDRSGDDQDPHDDGRSVSADMRRSDTRCRTTVTQRSPSLT